VTDASADERRATRLLWCYPRSWRARYGEEFVELLVAELSERPHSWRRGADVARTGMLARLGAIGLGPRVLEPAEQIRASLACVVAAVAVFLAFATAMWAQLTVGWQWSPPDTVATKSAVEVMSGAMVVFVALATAAAVPVLWCVLSGLVRSRPDLRAPASLVAIGTTLLLVGSRHFGNGWPGTGGHPWAHQGLVPGGVAAFSWASTLSISSYWVHPGALASFPPAELAWMAVSPLAMVALVVGAVKTVRRVHLGPRAWRFEAHLARGAAIVMLVFLGACGGWMVDGGPGPKNLFHVGAIDVAAIAAMAGSLAVALRAVSRAQRGGMGPLTA
jgi:hypothetical protein